MLALIECLGDQVVEARDAYEEFADVDATSLHRMSMIGLTKALEQLWYAKLATIKVSLHTSLTSRILCEQLKGVESQTDSSAVSKTSKQERRVA